MKLCYVKLMSNVILKMCYGGNDSQYNNYYLETHDWNKDHILFSRN